MKRLIVPIMYTAVGFLLCLILTPYRPLPQTFSAQTDYFAHFDAQRAQLRLLQLKAYETMGDPEALRDLARKSERETACELALSSRFQSAAVMITSRGVFACVRASALSPTEREQIVRMLVRETGLAQQQVFLSIVEP